MLRALPSVLLIGCSSDRLELMIILCRVLFGLRWPHGLSTGADEGDLSRDLYAMQTVQDSSLRSFASEDEDSEDGRMEHKRSRSRAAWCTNSAPSSHSRVLRYSQLG